MNFHWISSHLIQNSLNALNFVSDADNLNFDIIWILDKASTLLIYFF